MIPKKIKDEIESLPKEREGKWFEKYRVEPPVEMIAKIGGTSADLKILLIWSEDDGYSIGYDKVADTYELMYKSLIIQTYNTLKDAMNF